MVVDNSIEEQVSVAILVPGDGNTDYHYLIEVGY